jgi:hypothetical protein
MANLIPTPGWDAVPQLEINTKVLGGPSGPANSQAQALLDRTELIAQGSGTAASTLTGVEVVSVSQVNGGTPGIRATTLTTILNWLKNTLMTRSNNLSDVQSAATARTNLGLGAVATLNTVPVANGGTGQTSANGTTLDAITGFSGIGYLQRTGAGTYSFNPTPYSLPAATASALGGVKDGAGVTIAADGTISVDGTSNNAFNAGSGYRTNADGSFEMWGTASFPLGTNQIDITLPKAVPSGEMSMNMTDGGSTCLSYGMQLLNNTTLRLWCPAFFIDQGGGTVIARSLVAAGFWRILVI